MKMLLLSQNPVVNKLVTLSAQKTGDELVVAESLGEVGKGTYDLLVVDEGLYDSSVMEEVHERVAAVSTLFMGAHGTEVPEGFDHTLKKPFLPTDLVKLFVDISNEGPTLATPPEESDTIELAKEEDTFAFDEGESMEIESLDDAEIPMELGEELLEELPDLEEESEAVTPEEEEDIASILDEEEVHEVQSLLEDTGEAEVEPLLEDEPVSAGLNDATLDEVKSALDDLEGDDEGVLESGESEEADLSGLEFDEEILEDTADISSSELPEEALDLGELELGEETAAEEAAEAEEELDFGDLELGDEASDEAAEAETLDLGDLDFGDDEADQTGAGETDIDLADLEAADQAADQLLEEAGGLELPEAEGADLEELDFGTEEEASELLADTAEEETVGAAPAPELPETEEAVTDEDFDLGDLDLEMEEESAPEADIEESILETVEAEEESAVEEAGEAVGDLELSEESESPADEAFDLGDLGLDMEDEAAGPEEGIEGSLEAPEEPAAGEAGDMLGDMELSEESQSPLDESFDLGEEVTLGESEEPSEDEEESEISDLMPDTEELTSNVEFDEEAADFDALTLPEEEEVQAEKAFDLGDLEMEIAAETVSEEPMPETAAASAEAVPEAEAEETIPPEEESAEKRDLSAEAEALMSEAAAEAAISDDFNLEEEISAADEALDFEGLDLDDTADFVDTEEPEEAVEEAETVEEESTTEVPGLEAEAEDISHEELDLDEEMTEFLTTGEPEAGLSEDADEDMALKNLEAEIESAVSELSDEELAEEIDEETLLDIVNAEDYDEGETTAVVDEFDTLDSAELKAALGEVDESTPAAETEEPPAAAETEEAPTAEQMSPDEGLQALQTLVKALENKEVIKSLKGMNISINITFGDND